VRAAERLFDPLGLPAYAEHRVAEASGRDLVEEPGGERAPADVGDDLRLVADGRPQPRAESPGQDRDRDARKVGARAHALRKAPWGSRR
jgi:hypothetical protein